ncbi:MAG: hypothetical protein JSS62_02805 [Verrucomicrobia bacterium]|nr:hypothetical protein [Verrucomicrobiota bacterium]
MTRMSKQSERRARSPRKHKGPSQTTGSKKDLLPLGYKHHPNALGEKATCFIGKVRNCHVSS